MPEKLTVTQNHIQQAIYQIETDLNSGSPVQGSVVITTQSDEGNVKLFMVPVLKNAVGDFEVAVKVGDTLNSI